MSSENPIEKLVNIKDLLIFLSGDISQEMMRISDEMAFRLKGLHNSELTYSNLEEAEQMIEQMRRDFIKIYKKIDQAGLRPIDPKHLRQSDNSSDIDFK